MRIRNSRPCFPHTVTPEAMSRSASFRSKGVLSYEDNFNVQQKNRIVWSCCASGQSTSEVEGSQLQNNLDMEIQSGEKSLNKSEHENCRQIGMQETSILVSQNLEEVDNGGRKSNIFRTSKRQGHEFTFPPTVLALPAFSPLPGPERHMPIKKRKLYRQPIVTRRGVIEEPLFAATEVKIDRRIITDNTQRSKGIMNCGVNTESSILSPNVGSSQREGTNEIPSLEKAIMQEGIRKRRRGRPRKIDQPSMGMLGAYSLCPYSVDGVMYVTCLLIYFLSVKQLVDWCRVW
ncbi:hypothetical protein K2173_021791 [Erythroxylum novogranatense]|uniref:Uncharacterized protein n=1 Tax=Erythroxylum novogranatense TaxID=1862640 RepID=A0AAV8TV77_9ROSI|nr:hypothetical protein K2173_021791 [Erythroxylum novogranatense]